MSKLYMMAGGVATGGDPPSERVSAYVVLAEGVKSRLFKLGGEKKAPLIEEMPAATTLDLRRFREEMKKELDGLGPIQPADPAWACDVIRVHLRFDLGL